MIETNDSPIAETADTTVTKTRHPAPSPIPVPAPPQRSTPSVHQSRWNYVTPALAVLAIIVSVVAWFLSYRADVVQLGPLTGTPELDAYRAQVEELQRANDRILNTAWTTLGIVVTLAIVLVTFNFVRGDRLIERERTLIEERFEGAVNRQYGELQDSFSREKRLREDLSSDTKQSIDDLTRTTARLIKELQRERQQRATAQFQSVQSQNQMFRLVQEITSSSGPLLPFVYTRIYGPVSTAIGLLKPAIESELPSLINEALRQLRDMANGPIPANDPIPLDDLIKDVGELPSTYNPLRDEVIEALRNLAQTRPDVQYLNQNEA